MMSCSEGLTVVAHKSKTVSGNMAKRCVKMRRRLHGFIIMSDPVHIQVFTWSIVNIKILICAATDSYQKGNNFPESSMIRLYVFLLTSLHWPPDFSAFFFFFWQVTKSKSFLLDSCGKVKLLDEYKTQAVVERDVLVTLASTVSQLMKIKWLTQKKPLNLSLQRRTGNGYRASDAYMIYIK